jgi:hypothetical protein
LAILFYEGEEVDDVIGHHPRNSAGIILQGDNIAKARSFDVSNLTSWIGSDRNRFIPKKSPTDEYSWKIQLTFPHVSQPHPKKKSEKKNVGSFYSSIISQTFPQPETMAE